MTKTIHFHRRLLGRMLLLVVLPTAMILALVVTLAAARGYGNLRRAAERYLRHEAALAAERVDADNREAVVTAMRMAEAQMAGMFGDRKASLAYARRVLESSPRFTGAYFGYEPNADGSDRTSVDSLPAESMTPAGRFIPYFFKSPAKGGQIELEPLVDMETSLYYNGAREAFARTGQAQPMVTEPYEYQGKMIVEQTYPIVIDGRFVGVAGVDRALSDVEAEIVQLVARADAAAFLISRQGKLIAATTDAGRRERGETEGILKTRAVADTAYASLFRPVLSERRPMLLDAEDPLDGDEHYFASVPIPTGDWTLIVRESKDAVLGQIWGQLRFGIVLVVVGIVLIVVLLLASLLRVVRRLQQAVAAADRVAEGDLTQAIEPDDSADETGDLLRALAKMNANLNRLVGDVRQASIRLNSTATELAATSRQQEGTVSSFGASTSEIAAAVKEISTTSHELGQTMSEVSEVAGSTATLATTGREGLRSMEETMRGLDEATATIADKLAVINDKTSNITGVVTTITKVADQTNLLSVNAAIEAEKAGEYGVGFLVVAREIRRLADQTAAATTDIERMVEDMQSAVSTGVMEMDRFSDQVRHSVGDVAKISHQMTQIIEQVNGNVESFGSVNDGMQSQAQGAEQISDAMGQLTGGATQTIEAIREYATAAEDLQGSIATLKSSIASFHLKS